MDLPADHPRILTGKIGVLLVNLGTPDAPDESSVRRYLAEFLSDRRVVEIPQIFWQPILRGLVLRTRPRKSAHAYSQVWTEEGSPLAFHTAAQARALQARFVEGGLGDRVIVRHAMRYQKPAMAAELDKLLADGCERILVAPLYPQYSGATTGSALDAVAAWIKDRRRLSALRTLPPYFDDPLSITALHTDLAAQITALDFAPELLVLSFHGMPERTLRLGDPYHCHCQKTARLLSEAFAASHPDLRVATSFQSRFGRAKWLEPATDDVIKVQATNGVRRMVVAAPGFSSDCLETIEELGIRGREDFEAAGGTHFAALTCLNTSEPGMAMLEALIRRELAGWI